MDEDRSAPPEAPWRRALERAHALACLLPAAVLVWPGPGAPLRGDLQPDLTGAGWAALAAIPAALGVVLRAGWVRAPLTWLFLGVLGFGALSLGLGHPSDTLGASRATLLGLASLACLLGGASLREEGRRWLAGGAVAVALLALLPVAFATGDGLAGALGNKAATSETALAGALIGALALSAPGRWSRSAGGAAALLLALHAGRGPVLASALALGVVLLAATLLAPAGERGNARRRRLAFLMLACVVAVAGGRYERGARTPPAPVSAARPDLPHPSDVRGLEVRERIAKASLRMLAAHPLLGVGPGQFAAAFPPWRDPAELELSTLGRNLPGQVTEVEHAHDDWLEGALELGLAGGALWVVFLLAVGWRALRALRSTDLVRAALGAGALGVLVAAAARAPLSSDPASACVAFAVFGALLAPDEDERWPSAVARLATHAALLLLAFLSVRAWDLAKLGRELARLPHTTGARTPVLQRALDACPDSVLARALYARIAPAEAEAADPGASVDRVRLWQGVLELRPHHFEAWVQLGNVWARAGRLEEARVAYDHALELDPGDPLVRTNLARLEVEAGRPAAALEEVDWLEARGRLPDGWIAGAATEALRRLDLDTARALLRHAHPGWGELGAQEAWERADKLGEEASELARCLQGLAHVQWAREQMDAGDAATAVRSYRQAQNDLAWRPEGGGEVQVSRPLGLELAAALVRAGRPEDAAREIQRLGPQGGLPARLPEWARRALGEAPVPDR